ncbi:predicted protein [Coccidioides posadasii str. Silveira]|uniref:Predicted protein n=2 Tax=Coccidioides posadasii (strain RMSCC 757 / Silveira) TaxID=443226 RepID=E9DK33_COCPS|nr:predicted protein [Coccidioides posadasii str. Silveira]
MALRAGFSGNLTKRSNSGEAIFPRCWFKSFTMEGHRRKRANGQYQHSAHLLCSFVVNPALIDVQLHVDWDSRTVPLTWLKVQGPQESVEWPHCLDVHAYLGKAGKLAIFYGPVSTLP